MSVPALDRNGYAINVGDRVSITANVATIAGALVSSLIAVLPPLTTSTLSCQAGDLNVTEGVAASGSGLSYGNYFNPGDSCTVKGVVTAITNGPFGDTGLLTITLAYSGLSVSSVPSGAVTTDRF